MKCVRQFLQFKELSWKPEFSETAKATTLLTPMSEDHSDKAEKRMPSWVMPRPMRSSLTFFEQFYPLKVYNSMTRTCTPFVPINGNQVWPLSPVGHAVCLS